MRTTFWVIVDADSGELITDELYRSKKEAEKDQYLFYSYQSSPETRIKRVKVEGLK